MINLNVRAGQGELSAQIGLVLISVGRNGPSGRIFRLLHTCKIFVAELAPELATRWYILHVHIFQEDCLLPGTTYPSGGIAFAPELVGKIDVARSAYWFGADLCPIGSADLDDFGPVLQRGEAIRIGLRSIADGTIERNPAWFKIELDSEGPVSNLQAGGSLLLYRHEPTHCHKLCSYFSWSRNVWMACIICSITCREAMVPSGTSSGCPAPLMTSVAPFVTSSSSASSEAS